MNHPMNKRKKDEIVTLADLGKKVSERTGFTQRDVNFVLNEFVNVIIDELIKDNDVLVKNLGKFSLEHSKPHICTDARTGQKTMTSYSINIKFKQSRKMCDKLARIMDPSLDWGDDIIQAE